MDTCEIGIQVDLIKYRNSNSTAASTSETSQFKLHNQQQQQQQQQQPQQQHQSSSSTSPGECSSSVVRKDKCKGSSNVKKLPSNIQSDLECSLGPIDAGGGKNLGHHMVDLGKFSSTFSIRVMS